MQNIKEVIQLKNINKIYNQGKCQVDALKNINLTVEKGDFLAIVGQSGSGKSTLMNICGCLDSPTSGQYFLEGEDISTLTEKQLAIIRNNKIGFIFQGFNLVPNLTAIENIELPLIYRKINAKKRREIAKNSLLAVGLLNRENHYPYQLSGGQQQRISIARAIASKPSIILADEPTGNLDSKSGEIIMEILCSLNKDEGVTIIIITHDKNVANTAKKVIEIHDGEIIF